MLFDYNAENSQHKLCGWNDNRNYSDHPFNSSADAWIFHSKFNVPTGLRDHFDFILGIPHCENRFHYLMYVLRYILIRDPYYVRIFHHHQSEKRNYTEKDAILGDCIYIMPYNCTLTKANEGVKIQPVPNTESISCVK